MGKKTAEAVAAASRKKDDEFNFASTMSRLADDKKVVEDPALLTRMQELISIATTRMCTKPEKGGNPFVFVMMADKMHFIRDEISGMDFRTAATDGRAFYWSPLLLEALLDQPVSKTMLIMKHEVYHNIFFHTLESRRAGRRRDVWAMVIDWMVNAAIEDETQKARPETRKTLWELDLAWPKKVIRQDMKNGEQEEVFEDRDTNGRLHVERVTPCTIDHYLDFLAAKTDSSGNEIKIAEPLVYADIKALQYSLDDLYALIIDAMQKSPRRCKEPEGGCGALSIDPRTGISKIPQPWAPDACKKCGARPAPDGFGSDDGFGTGTGAGFDQHMDCKKSKQEIIEEVTRAAENAKTISRGNLPAGIDALLQSLEDPELTPRDLMVNALHRRVMDEGVNNDWSRMRRRPTYLYRSTPRIVVNPKTKKEEIVNSLVKTGRLARPKLYDFAPRWVAAIDTSGSMTDSDIAYGLKEIKVVAAQTATEGYLVPLDAQPYWDRAVKVEQKADLARFNVVGRGGTVFFEFFRDLEKHYDELDMVVVVTDGFIDTIPAHFAPPCEVIWIITSGFEEFAPPFGRKCTLRSRRRGANS